jgi:indole-3-glycerol phosphate synthase
MTFLSDILDRKREEVGARRLAMPDAILESALPAPVGKSGRFASALIPTGAEGLGVIAEVKRASPSVGQIDPSVDAPALAEKYSKAGALAISVLTDGPGFGGSLDDLRAVRSRVQTPVLRKDFIVSRYQLLEARHAGADIVLLIVAALAPDRLAELHGQAQALGLEVLVEVHDELELEAALEAGARIVGVNNRNLKTFEVDLAVSERVLPRIPSTVRAISESGVKGVEEVRRLRGSGARNFLIGEALVRSGDPARFLDSLRSVR